MNIIHFAFVSVVITGVVVTATRHIHKYHILHPEEPCTYSCEPTFAHDPFGLLTVSVDVVFLILPVNNKGALQVKGIGSKYYNPV